MYNLVLALHLILAVFAVGPLVAAATTAGRGVRRGDGAATAASARMLRLYSYASLLVIIVGMGLMSMKDPDDPGVKAGKITETWVWLSLVLWVLAIALVLAVIVPTLTKATSQITAEQSVVTMTSRVAAAGGVVAVLFAVIIVLMVYRPGH